MANYVKKCGQKSISLVDYIQYIESERHIFKKNMEGGLGNERSFGGKRFNDYHYLCIG